MSSVESSFRVWRVVLQNRFVRRRRRKRTGPLDFHTFKSHLGDYWGLIPEDTKDVKPVEYRVLQGPLFKKPGRDPTSQKAVGMPCFNCKRPCGT